MRHHIPSVLALTLVVSVSFLMGQLVVNQSQAVEDQYAAIDFTSPPKVVPAAEVK